MEMNPDNVRYIRFYIPVAPPTRQHVNFPRQKKGTGTCQRVQ